MTRRRPRSTARFISYDLRPSKQSERRILIDVLKAGSDCGLPLDTYRYVGMGANRFYDFVLIHKYLGISDMVSLEHDPDMVKRAEFNVPYRFITIEPLSASEFIAADPCERPSVFWLDYDGGLGPTITGDIQSLATKAKVGDFVFVTVFGGPPRVVDRESDEERLRWLQDNLPDLAGDVTVEDVEKSAFPDAVHKVLMSAFKNAFAARRDGKFFPLLQVEYTDSTPMVTVGGGFLADGQGYAIQRKLKSTLPFLESSDSGMYEIKSLHLTERERALFDLATTQAYKRSPEMNQLRKLGFEQKEIDAYRELIRHLPRYVETMV